MVHANLNVRQKIKNENPDVIGGFLLIFKPYLAKQRKTV